MANWNFTADSDIQKEVSKELNNAADNFDAKIALMYGQIDGMSANWVGEDFDAFKEGTHNYEGALKDLSDSFRMYSKHFESLSDATYTLATELIAIVNNMTGTNYSSSNAPGTNLNNPTGVPNQNGQVPPANGQVPPVNQNNGGDPNANQNPTGQNNPPAANNQVDPNASQNPDPNQNATVPGVQGGNVTGTNPDNDNDSNNDIVANSTTYTVATEGRTAAQMYQDACDLKNEVYVEIEYLSDYQRDLEYARSALELNKDSMDSATYNELMEEYNLRISTCETELLKRSNLYNDLNTVTADNFGATDGALKDAQDWGSNDLFVAKETLFTINENASLLTPISSISSETNGIGENAEQTNALSISAVYSSDMNDYGAYSENIDSISTYGNCSVSNLTLRSAYAAAGKNVIELNTLPGVYLFNTKDYLLNPEIQNMPPMGGVTSIPESTLLSYSTFQGMDSVYDSNTGKFYTYDQWNSMQSGLIQ